MEQAFSSLKFCLWICFRNERKFYYFSNIITILPDYRKKLLLVWSSISLNSNYFILFVSFSYTFDLQHDYVVDLYQSSSTEWPINILCILTPGFERDFHLPNSLWLNWTTVDSLYLEYPLSRTSLFLELKSQSLCVSCNLFFSLYLKLSLSRTNFRDPCEFEIERVNCIYIHWRSHLKNILNTIFNFMTSKSYFSHSLWESHQYSYQIWFGLVSRCPKELKVPNLYFVTWVHDQLLWGPNAFREER